MIQKTPIAGGINKGIGKKNNNSQIAFSGTIRSGRPAAVLVENEMTFKTPSLMGMSLVGVSAIVWSTVGLFAKGISADVWVILFWRGLFSAIVLSIYVQRRSGHNIVREIRGLGWPGWSATFVGATATICFISAFKFTSIANVSIIYAAVPFIASAFAWISIGEKTSRVTIVAALLSLIGVTVMIGGSVGSTNLIGDLLAICMSLGMAALVVIFRKYPSRPIVLSVALSALLHVALSFTISSPFDVSRQDLVLLIVFGVVFSAATILMIEGTKLIPASQSALISTLESPLAPLWAWLVFFEFPTLNTWIGGGLVLFAVAGNVLYEYSCSQKKR